MSDDLISRKVLYEAFSDYCNRNIIGEISSQTELSIGEIASVIKSIPTVFDKEKVIEELFHPDPIIRTFVGKQFTTIDRAIEIVKKGGIE